MRHPPKYWLIPYWFTAATIMTVTATCYYPIREGYLPSYIWIVLVQLAIACNIYPAILFRVFYSNRPKRPKAKQPRQFVSGLSVSGIRACAHGLQILHVFILTSIPAVSIFLWRAPMLWQGQWREWLISAGIAFAVVAILFGNGMLSIYLSSTQLGTRRRIWGIIIGLIPVAQLFALRFIMRTVYREIEHERARILRNEARAADAVCATKYPLLLVHGICFRDFKRLNYWGRIPGELITNGATVYYGEQPSAVSVRESAHILADRIRKLAEETGCEKVNVIAHSKGGLDIRAALAFEDIAPYIASVTTVNTPHCGCHYADFLLGSASDNFRRRVARTYNRIARLCGDPKPDFLAAVSDLTVAGCAHFNAETDGEIAHTDGILCRSIHSRMNHASGAPFPLNITYTLAKWFDGPNDGLVADDSAAWGESLRMVTSGGRRGVTHCDMTDLFRLDIEDFDVREFYVEWVADLKERGL